MHPKDPKEVIDLFKKIYDKNAPGVVERSETPKIPKIIHQIWIGGHLPDPYKDLQKSWEEKNPGWTYKLWTDVDVIKLKLFNQDLYNAASNTDKADILRYEILYRVWRCLC